MSKLYWLWVLVIAVAFGGVYLIWSAPTPQSISIPVASGNFKSAIPVANVTIVPAAMTKEGVPATLGALSLTQTETGATALAEFTQLHGKGLELVGGYRADYSSKDSTATLWVGQAKDAASAQVLLDEMAQKIGPSNATFQNLQSLAISGRTLYTADGLGQKHFFYAVNDKIVWLAADASQAADVLHSLWSAVK